MEMVFKCCQSYLFNPLDEAAIISLVAGHRSLLPVFPRLETSHWSPGRLHHHHHDQIRKTLNHQFYYHLLPSFAVNSKCYTLSHTTLNFVRKHPSTPRSVDDNKDLLQSQTLDKRFCQHDICAPNRVRRPGFRQILLSIRLPSKNRLYVLLYSVGALTTH